MDPFGQVAKAYIEYKRAKFLSFALYSNRKNVQHRALISVHAYTFAVFNTEQRDSNPQPHGFESAPLPARPSDMPECII